MKKLLLCMAMLLFMATPCFADECQHQWGDWVTSIEPTCGMAGAKVRTCSICNSVELGTIPATGEHVWGDPQVYKEQTCTTDGELRKYCSVCNLYLRATLPAPGHQWSEWIVTAYQSCYQDGEKYRTCSACGLKETSVVPAYDTHDWGEWETIQASTCKSNGLRSHRCNRCGELEYDTLPPSNIHTFTGAPSETIQYPTPFRYGIDRTWCECGVTFKDIRTPKLKAFIKISKKSLKLKRRKVKKLTVKMAYGDKVKSWRSSNKKVAIVNKKGKVTALKKGKTVITVTLKSGKKATCKVTVK